MYTYPCKDDESTMRKWGVKLEKQINEGDNASRHLMNGTAAFDHWQRRYLVIIYSSNQSADTESQEEEEEERENRWRCTERHNLL